MNIWMNRKNFMKHHCLKKNTSSAAGPTECWPGKACVTLAFWLNFKEVYSNLNMEDITDSDYNHAKWVWKTHLRKTEVDLELLKDINMLLMVEKGIRGRICHATHQYVKNNERKIMMRITSTVMSTVLLLQIMGR